MIPPVSFRGLTKLFRWTGAMGCCLAGAGGLGAEDWQSLLARPPFGEHAAPAPAGRADWEFRGVVKEEGDLVNLYNPATKTSQWIPVPGRAGEIEALAYDPASGQLRITQAGRPLTLTLKHARISLLGYATTVQLIDPAQPPVDDPAVPDFMRNLPPDARKLLEDVRRRRAIREPFPGTEPLPPARAAEPDVRPRTP